MRERRRVPQAAEEARPEAVANAAPYASALGDSLEFTLLFDYYWESVLRFCYYRLGDWTDAEDAASQVFTNALAAFDRFRPCGNAEAVRSWLFTIAYRVVANAYRHRARHRTQPIDSVIGWADPAPSPEDLALAADDHRRLRALLAQLPTDQRELLELRLAGLTAVDIAHVLGRSHDAVRKAESRAVRHLRDLSAMSAAAADDKEAAHG